MHLRLVSGIGSLLATACLVLVSGASCSYAAARAGRSQPRVQVVNAHLEEDRRAERIMLDPNHDPTVSVWRSGRCLWRDVPERWKPWKLAAADVDGDGLQEIIVGVYKSTRFYPFLHNCLFVFGWNGKAGYRKWLGSSLSKPFVDFMFVHHQGRRAAQLVSVEKLRSGRFCIVAYSWNGFGFTGDWQRGEWKHVRLAHSSGSKIIIVADGQRLSVGG